MSDNSRLLKKLHPDRRRLCRAVSCFEPRMSDISSVCVYHYNMWNRYYSTKKVMLQIKPVGVMIGDFIKDVDNGKLY